MIECYYDSNFANFICIYAKKSVPLQLQTQNYTFLMSEKELHSYRLSSLKEPTDEQLSALMEQVGEAIHASTQRVAEIHHRHIQEIAEL